MHPLRIPVVLREDRAAELLVEPEALRELVHLLILQPLIHFIGAHMDNALQLVLDKVAGLEKSMVVLSTQSDSLISGYTDVKSQLAQLLGGQTSGNVLVAVSDITAIAERIDAITTSATKEAAAELAALSAAAPAPSPAPAPAPTPAPAPAVDPATGPVVIFPGDPAHPATPADASVDRMSIPVKPVGPQ